MTADSGYKIKPLTREEFRDTDVLAWPPEIFELHIKSLFSDEKFVTFMRQPSTYKYRGEEEKCIAFFNNLYDNYAKYDTHTQIKHLLYLFNVSHIEKRFNDIIRYEYIVNNNKVRCAIYMYAFVKSLVMWFPEFWVGPPPTHTYPKMF